MKKIVLSIIIVFAFMMVQSSVFASEYLTYQSIRFDRFGGQLLRDYTKSDYEQYYDMLGGRRFWGWRTVTVMNNEPVTFQKETRYVITNQGTSPINKSYHFRLTESSKVQLSASGNIGISTSGNVRGFSLGLDANIDGRISNERSTTEEERVEIRMKVDPNTALKVAVYGEGYITNGVGKYYRFFINARTGGWEVFVLTTEYFSVVKEVIDEDLRR